MTLAYSNSSTIIYLTIAANQQQGTEEKQAAHQDTFTVEHTKWKWEHRHEHEFKKKEHYSRVWAKKGWEAKWIAHATTRCAPFVGHACIEWVDSNQFHLHTKLCLVGCEISTHMKILIAIGPDTWPKHEFDDSWRGLQGGAFDFAGEIDTPFKKQQRCKRPIIAVGFRKKAHEMKFCLCREAHLLSHPFSENDEDETVLCSGKSTIHSTESGQPVTHNACHYGQL